MEHNEAADLASTEHASPPTSMSPSKWPRAIASELAKSPPAVRRKRYEEMLEEATEESDFDQLSLISQDEKELRMEKLAVLPLLQQAPVACALPSPKWTSQFDRSLGVASKSDGN